MHRHRRQSTRCHKATAERIHRDFTCIKLGVELCYSSRLPFIAEQHTSILSPIVFVVSVALHPTAQPHSPPGLITAPRPISTSAQIWSGDFNKGRHPFPLILSIGGTDTRRSAVESRVTATRRKETGRHRTVQEDLADIYQSRHYCHIQHQSQRHAPATNAWRISSWPLLWSNNIAT